jgi:hypothetical protein
MRDFFLFWIGGTITASRRLNVSATDSTNLSDCLSVRDFNACISILTLLGDIFDKSKPRTWEEIPATKERICEEHTSSNTFLKVNETVRLK